jgi:hypothetical protein
MRLQEWLAAVIAAAALIFFSINFAVAREDNHTKFKACCDQSYAVYYQFGGKRSCKLRGEAQKDAFYKCVHDGAVRVKHGGQGA